MFSSIASQFFKLEEIINPSILEETTNLFQPLEKVKIQIQTQKILEEINSRLNNLRVRVQ